VSEYVRSQDACAFIESLEDASVGLVLIDPPYYGIVDDSWDNQWASEDDYVSWLSVMCYAARKKLTPTGSLLVFGGVGKHGSHPFFRVISELEKKFHFRNLITWKKRRAYGKKFNYLHCREEIVWYSKSSVESEVTFNIPYLTEKRGYAGFNKKYPAKSPYYRVSNVWADIGELMRPKRTAEKPIPLLERLILTHSNPNDLVVDFFAGTGSTGVAALKNGRRFLGCDMDNTAVQMANARCISVYDSTSYHHGANTEDSNLCVSDPMQDQQQEICGDHCKNSTEKI